MSKTALAVGTLITVLLIGAVSYYMHVRSKAEASSCVAYLFKIDLSKQQWALEHNARTNASVSWEQVQDYYKLPGRPPPCPGGGTYTLGRIGELPSCSIPAHTAYFRELR